MITKTKRRSKRPHILQKGKAMILLEVSREEKGKIEKQKIAEKNQSTVEKIRNKNKKK